MAEDSNGIPDLNHAASATGGGMDIQAGMDDLPSYHAIGETGLFPSLADPLRPGRDLRSLIARCGSLLAKSGSEVLLLEEVCRSMVEDGGCSLALAGYYDECGDLSLVTWHGSPDPSGAIPLLREEISNSFGSAPVSVNPGCIPEFGGESAKRAWRRLALEWGCRSAVFLPLSESGKVFGVLNLYSTEPDTWQENDFEALQHLAEMLSFGTTAIRMCETLRKSSDDLKLKNLLLAASQEVSMDGLLLVDENGRMLTFNQRFLDMWGEPSSGHFALERLVDPEEYLAGMEIPDRLRDQSMLDEIMFTDGRVVERSSTPLKCENGRFHGRLWTFRDITERRNQERNRYLAHFDSLTGLPNRALLLDRLDQALTSAERSRKQVAVLFLDLNRFKQVNDTLGHECGDILLKTVAERLKACVRKVDTVARLGGDEFVMVLPGINSREPVSSITNNLIASISAPVSLPGTTEAVSVSIGVSFYPEDGRDAATLIGNADSAMYAGKRSGQSSCQFFNGERRRRELAQEAGLKKALEDGELSMRFLPQTELKSGRLTGAEVVPGWISPEGEGFFHRDLLSLAEERLLAEPLFEWMLVTSLSQIASWDRRFAIPVCLAVPEALLRRKEFPAGIDGALKKFGVDPSMLCLEMAEDSVNRDSSARILCEFREIGLGIEVGEFGASSSCLWNLRRYPVSGLKMAQSLVRSMLLDEDAGAIVKAITAMGKSLGLRVIARGVESGEQRDYLQEIGCDEVQGNYFSDPVSPEILAGFLFSAIEN